MESSYLQIKIMKFKCIAKTKINKKRLEWPIFFKKGWEKMEVQIERKDKNSFKKSKNNKNMLQHEPTDRYTRYEKWLMGWRKYPLYVIILGG